MSDAGGVNDQSTLIVPRTRHQTFSEESQPLRALPGTRNLSHSRSQGHEYMSNATTSRNPLDLALSLPVTADFPETDFSFTSGAYTAPVQVDDNIWRFVSFNREQKYE